MTGTQWELMNSTNSFDPDASSPDAPGAAYAAPPTRKPWPELVAIGVVVVVIALLASTGPTPAELAQRVAQRPSDTADPNLASLVDRTLVEPGETVASAEPLVVFARPSVELDFFPGTLGKEVPFVEILGIDGAIVLATGNLSAADLAQSAGEDGSFEVEKVTLVGRVDGRLVSVVQSTVSDDARLRCDGLRDNGPLILTDCAPLGLPHTPEPASFESALSTTVTETHIYAMGLADDVAVVAVSSDSGQYWQRPVGGIAVLPASNASSRPLELTLFGADGKLISTQQVA